MKVIDAFSVPNGYYKALFYLLESGVEESSRNGKVIVARTPVTTRFYNPEKRVLLDPVRDCNPFFHLMEAVWMLAGRNDVEFVSQFNKRMAEYSDNSLTLNAAYGHRWRSYFGRDQLIDAYDELSQNPSSRRCVITMWDAVFDGKGSSKDYPCNTHIYFRTQNQRLDMTVCNRSNDIYWGLFGANAVHLSILHEIMASALRLRMGFWHQMSNNFHLYPANLPMPFQELCAHYYETNAMANHEYADPNWSNTMTLPLMYQSDELPRLLDECAKFCRDPNPNSGFNLLDRIAFPMYRLWETRDRFWLMSIDDLMWRKACEEWLDRRAAK